MTEDDKTFQSCDKSNHSYLNRCRCVTYRITKKDAYWVVTSKTRICTGSIYSRKAFI